MTKYIFTLLTILMCFNACSNETQHKEAPELPPVKYQSLKGLIGAGEPIMLEMGSTDCGSCKEMGKLLYKVKAKFPCAHIYFVDIKKERDIASMYNVRMMPTQIFLDAEGTVIDTHIGPYESKQLMEKLKIVGIIK